MAIATKQQWIPEIELMDALCRIDQTGAEDFIEAIDRKIDLIRAEGATQSEGVGGSELYRLTVRMVDRVETLLRLKTQLQRMLESPDKNE